MKTVGSHPGAGVFRFTLVVGLVLVLMVAFFYYTTAVQRRVEEVARDQMVVSIKQALSTMLYDYAIKGQLKDLQLFDHENPFVPLAIYRELPKNYHGTIRARSEIKQSGWYFDLTKRVAVYQFSDEERLLESFKLTFQYQDSDRNGIFSEGDVGYLDIERI